MDEEAGWCILRTSGGRTLRLATSLREAGIDAWTPSQSQKRRRPRSRIMVTRDVPIVPSFVFADKDRIEDLLVMARRSSIAYPPFSLFRHCGRIPIIADKDIAALRAAEDRAKRAILKRYRFTAERGARVQPTEGAWAGLEGIVEDVAGNFAVVCFGGVRVKVASWLLDPNAVKAA